MTTNILNINIADRGAFRKKLAAFLKRNCATPKTVLPYVPAILKGQVPLITVTGGPSDRQVDTPKSYNNAFGFAVRLIVPYNMPGSADWSPEMAEDLLDTLEREASLALLLAQMQSEAQGWRSISRQGASVFDSVKEEGMTFLAETLPVIMEVDDGQE